MSAYLGLLAQGVSTNTIIVGMVSSDEFFSHLNQTTVTVSSSNNPAVFGESVTFTATVAGTSAGLGTPTGTVTFTDNTNGSTLGTGTLGSTGTATVSSSSLTVGTHDISVSYSGDSKFAAGSGSLTQTINQASSITTVTSATNPSVFGQSVTFTATVAAVAPGAGTPSGNVTFTDTTTSTTLGTGTLSSGTATFSTSSLAVGMHGISVTYDGDTNFGGSSGSVTQTVNKAATTTAVTSSLTPSVSGQSVTFTATVTATSPGAGTPTGTVTFTDSTTSTTLGTGTLNSSGVATLSTGSLTTATHTITATYAGDTNFATSNGTVTQTVNKAATTTAVISSVNPSVFGQPITLTATVQPTSPGGGTPTGTVTFEDTTTSTSLGSATLNGTGVATLSNVSSLSIATHTITATYAGDTNFATSNGSVTQTVGKAGTTTTVTSSANPAVNGQSVTFTATVTPTSPGAGTPTGTVTFEDTTTSTSLGSGTLSGGVATLSTLSLKVGSHAITATYGGDSNFTTSNGSLTQTVNTAGTSTALTSSVNPSVFGQSVTLTATVSPTAPGAGTPTGTVTFLDTTTNTTLGSGTLDSNGIATISTSDLSVGSHAIIATYGGDTNFNSSNGSLTQMVNQAATITTLASSANPSASGDLVTFTATVQSMAPGAGTPTGTVTFVDTSNNNAPLGSGTLDINGVATVSTSSLTSGDHIISATYGGDTDFSTSNQTLDQTVM